MLSAAAPNLLLTGRVIDFTWRSTGSIPDLEMGFPAKWNGWPYAHGGNMAATRPVFTKLNGFDENILIGGSEIEFAIRAQLLGGAQIVGVPDDIYYRQPHGSKGLMRKNFDRERGYAYISITHSNSVSDVGWKVALFQLWAASSDAERDPRTELASAQELITCTESADSRAGRTGE